MYYKIALMALALVFVMFPLGDAYSTKISCAEDVDLQEYPICKYVSEWNESEEFEEKLLVELTNRVDEINSNPELYLQIYLEALNKVNQENPGLEEKCEKLKDWIFDQLRSN